MHKIECFLLNIKELYPNFQYPSYETIRKWKDILEPYTADEIISAIKQWRKNNSIQNAPDVELFKSYLVKKNEKNLTKCQFLPFNPESYLMEQDIKANRCKHLYPIYCRAVKYIINTRLKNFCSKNEFKHLNYSQRYTMAVEKGLFADFDKILDFVSTNGGNYD